MTGICGEKNLRMNIKNRQVFFFFFGQEISGPEQRKTEAATSGFCIEIRDCQVLPRPDSSWRPIIPLLQLCSLVWHLNPNRSSGFQKVVVQPPYRWEVWLTLTWTQIPQNVMSRVSRYPSGSTLCTLLLCAVCPESIQTQSLASPPNSTNNLHAPTLW
jgi:hypothetical protein